MRKVFMMCVICMLFSSCATIFCGSRKKIVLESNIDKADKLDVDSRKYRDVTFPFPVKVKRGFSQSIVKGEKEGYTPVLIYIDKTFNAVSVLNLLDIVAWGIDAATGAMMKPEFNTYELHFETPKQEQKSNN